MTTGDTKIAHFRAVADHAVLVEFGDVIAPDIYEQVWRLDAALTSTPIDGVIEVVPAYTSLLVDFDPLVTNHAGIERAINRLLARAGKARNTGPMREVSVCYDADFAPDLEAVAAATGLTRENVIEAHLGASYRVIMYGFVPGYAYLAGVPEILQLPRKAAAVRGIPAGSVLIAGPQCLVTTMTMPTGWWIIGRSPTTILGADGDSPFLFDVGDDVRFKRIDRPSFDAESRRG